MVRWYHAIFTAYGFWLPNDPRGSWSTFVGSWELFKFGGGAMKTNTRHSVARASHDTEMRRETKALLKYPLVRFDQRQRDCIARGIEQAIADISIDLLALAIGYDHAHAIVARGNQSIEEVIRRFKSRATQHMNRAGCHPMRSTPTPQGTLHTPWAEGCWHVFINDESQLQTAIDYVARHPAKEGLPPQHWPFLKSV